MAVALAVARRSIVLLENDGTLPLPADLARIAVIGPNADDARNLVGDYGHIVHIETLLENRGREGVAGSAAPLDLQLADELASWATVLEAIRTRLGPGTEVRYAAGCGVLDGEDADIAAAVEAARGAEVAILVLGERSGLTAQCTCGETRDRCELGLPGRQAELVAAVAATGTPVVLVLVSGRPLAIPAEAALAAAVLHAWVPGEAGPEAIADVLFGDVEPGGKLPVTVPRHVGQVPLHYAHKPSGGRSKWHEDYVDGSHLPLWPFGFGLSYSRSSSASSAEQPDDARGWRGRHQRGRGQHGRAGGRRGRAALPARPAGQRHPTGQGAARLRPRRRSQPASDAPSRFAPGRRAARLHGCGRRAGRRARPASRHGRDLRRSDLPLSVDVEVVGEVRELTARSRYLTRVSISQGAPVDGEAGGRRLGRGPGAAAARPLRAMTSRYHQALSRGVRCLRLEVHVDDAEAHVRSRATTRSCPAATTRSSRARRRPASMAASSARRCASR